MCDGPFSQLFWPNSILYMCLTKAIYILYDKDLYVQSDVMQVVLVSCPANFSL